MVVTYSQGQCRVAAPFEVTIAAAARGHRGCVNDFVREARAALLATPNVAAVFQFGASPNGAGAFTQWNCRGRNAGDACGGMVPLKLNCSGNCDPNYAALMAAAPRV